MSDVLIRQTSAVPAEAIVRLYRAGGWWREGIDDAAEIPRLVAGSFCFVVAEDRDGQIIGMGRAISDGVSDAYIQDVVVLESLRGRGIGGLIVERLVATCRERGLKWIGLVAEPGTTAFYERLGLREQKGYRMMLADPPCR